TGAHSLTAAFDGTADFTDSASAQFAYAVAKATPTVSVKATPAPQDTVTLRAEVGPAAPGAAKPTGTVTFKDGAAVLGTVALGTGPASLSGVKLTHGAHTLTAIFGGDANYLTAPTDLSLTIA